ncbi:MAG: ATP-dependent DNA helicase RecG [Candidatus Brennerbacteria bacterium]|nr:ATP-dependent DNA helicase RecG [Candidatus Brennerbacteria bacterium]
MGVLTLETPLASIHGIAPRYLAALKRLKIATVRDLLYHFPSRYEDYSRVYRIAELEPGQDATIQGDIYEVNGRKTWGRTHYLTETIITDGENSIRAVWWNQPYLKNTLRPGVRINISGKVSENDNGEIYFSNPAYELLTTHYSPHDPTHTARIVPVYPETHGLTSKGIRYILRPILENTSAEDILSEELLEQEGFPSLGSALHAIHFPDKLSEAEVAKRRFAFEDLFLLELINARERARLAKERAPVIPLAEKRRKELMGALPFTLTETQTKALDDILADIARPHPMNRLLQGDVGSGKTVVAAIAARAAAETEYQTAFMAPTEILARQHYTTLKGFFADFEGGIGLLTGSGARIFLGDGLERNAKKEEMRSMLKHGEIAIVIGTHALIAQNVAFPRLALVVVDEQHRFGVSQRAALAREGMTPHFLSMSATPIPRTFALTLFGNLAVSQITELPKGRKEITTKVVAPADRLKAYAFIKEFVKRGRQVFVVCPRITNEHELDANTTNDIREIRARIREYSLLEMKNVTEEYEKLSEKVFPDLRVTMLHGKLKAKEKIEIMDRFAKGAIDILVSTAVIEVGVDVPNATIMVVESAERFGLAQLYQFRGRVGRGTHQSFFFLFTGSPSEATKKRLEAVTRAKNGFELAEEDLKLRGPGEFLGTIQTGMPDVAMKALQHPALIPKARTAAEALTGKDPALSRYPALKNRLEAFARTVHFE